VALLADAGHMLTDAGALALALMAARLSAKPRDARRSYGYGRTEVLAALGNGLLLGGVSVAIAIESLERLSAPREVDAVPMLIVAIAGLCANLVAARLLHAHAHASLNVRAAFWHVVGDALGSMAAIVAAACILLWGWTQADALGGLAIALLLVASAFQLVRDSVDILLEGTPRHLDLQAIARQARELPGVESIHDLHIWTVSSGFTAMSAHVDLRTGADAEQVRRAVHRLLHEGYGIEHTTIQTEAAPGLLSIADCAEAPADDPGCSGSSPRGRSENLRL
jgi:cobalt-zinc-cadmium efflux system protein